MSKQIKFQNIGWNEKIVLNEGFADDRRADWRVSHESDTVEDVVDKLYDSWRASYQDTSNVEEHDMQLAFELGCQAAFEHGEWVLTDVNNITEDILREYHVKSDRGTIDAFRGGVEAILANQ